MIKVNSPADLQRLLQDVCQPESQLTEDELASYTAAACNLAKEKIAETQELMPFVHFIVTTRAGRSTIHSPLPSDLMESPGTKNVLFQALAMMANDLSALAMITVSDALSLSTPEDWKTTKSVEWWRGMMDYASKHGTVAAAAAGYGRVIEIIAACGQTKQHLVLHSQEYERHGANGLIQPTNKCCPHSRTDIDKVPRSGTNNPIIAVPA